MDYFTKFDDLMTRVSNDSVTLGDARDEYGKSVASIAMIDGADGVYDSDHEVIPLTVEGISEGYTHAKMRDMESRTVTGLFKALDLVKMSLLDEEVEEYEFEKVPEWLHKHYRTKQDFDRVASILD